MLYHPCLSLTGVAFWGAHITLLYPTQSNLKQGQVHKLYQLVQSPVRKYIVNIDPLYHTLV